MNFKKIFFHLLSIGILFSSVSSFTTTTTKRGSFVAPKQSTKALSMTLLNYNGKKVEVKEGTPLSAACKKAGMKVKYSCKK